MKLFEDPEKEKFRVIDKKGEPWFLLSEVCTKIGISNPAAAAARLDDDEKGIISIDTLGGHQNKRIINESGLYSLILTSRKPEAKQFKKWITSEVLPSIRETGSYGNTTPAFIKRATLNWNRVEIGYFSVINELAVLVAGRLEMAGHIMADRAPDGREFGQTTVSGVCFPIGLRSNIQIFARTTKCTLMKHLNGKVTCDNTLILYSRFFESMLKQSGGPSVLLDI